MDEEKDQISFRLLCNACLCVGRTLYPITDDSSKRYYLGALREIPICGLPEILPNICWDCKALLRRAIDFREQVKDSYRILVTYTNESLHECLFTDVSRPPRLNIKCNESINIEPDDNYHNGMEKSRASKREKVKKKQKEEEKALNEVEELKEELSNAEPPNSQETQEVFVKEELKLECWDSDRDFSDALSEDQNTTQIDTLAEIDEQICTILTDDKNVAKKVRKRSKKSVERLRSKKNVKEKEEEKALNEVEELKEELSNAEPPNSQETQEGFVKEELKTECWDSDRDFSDALSEDQNTSQIDTLAEIDERICNILTDDKNVAKKVRKRSKKSVERLRSKKNVKEAPGIQTIDLSYEELMAEREIEYTRDNYVNAEYKCETCILGFAYAKSLEAHLSAKHSNDIGNYTCPICKTVLASVDSFTAHYKRHTRRYECSICQKRTMDVKVMKQHYYTKHDLSLKKHTCADCGKISNSRDAHRYHVGTHKSRLQCPECDKTFRHRGGLLNHRLAVHELGNVFPCNLCDKVFRWKNSLKRHLDTHDTKNKSTSGAAYCAPCSVSFASLSSYQRHLNNSLKHVTKDDFRFICDHCKRRFADKTKLRDHIEEKHLHRSYHCDICVKVYKNRVNLDQHVRNVHKGRPNHKICHHCGKGFPTTVQLESHIRTHTGERPFICEFCPTTFSQQSNLYKHNRQVHLNMKTKRYPIAKKRKDERNDAILESSVQQIMPLEYAVEIEFPIGPLE